MKDLHDFSSFEKTPQKQQNSQNSAPSRNHSFHSFHAGGQAAALAPLSAGRGGVPCRGSPLSLTSFGSSPAGGAKCQPVGKGQVSGKRKPEKTSPYHKLLAEERTCTCLPLRDCAAEPRPADEAGEAEQGQPSKFASGLRPAPQIWLTATKSGMSRQRHDGEGSKGGKLYRRGEPPLRCPANKKPEAAASGFLVGGAGCGAPDLLRPSPRACKSRPRPLLRLGCFARRARLGCAAVQASNCVRRCDVRQIKKPRP